VGRDDVGRAIDLARALQEASGEAAAPPPPAPVPDPVRRFYDVVDDEELASASRRLFIDGHYALAVEEGFKLLVNLVKQRAGMRTGSTGDAAVMTTAFSEKASKLRLSEDLRTQSARDRQQGYMLMFQGAMIGVRNPRAHTHGHPDDPRNALELLAFCNHLIRTTREATRTRKPRKSSP
jgi:uncharacterized protein (TIGR02391 family)